MAPSGPAPAMVGNETSFSRPLSRRKLSSASTASISVRPRGASRSNQAKNFVTAAPSRSCAARAPAISVGVLHRLHRRDRIAAAHDLAAVLDDEARDRFGAGRGIEPHGAMRLAELGEIALEGGVGAHLGDLLETGAHIVAELAQIDIERRPALPSAPMAKASTTGVCGTSLPRMLNSHDTSCGSDTTSASAAIFSISACRRLSLSAVVFAGIAQIVRHHGAERRLRPVGPDGVDRIVFDRNQHGARRGAGFGEPLGAFDRMQPRRIAELGLLPADCFRSTASADSRPRARRKKSCRRFPRAPAPDSGRRRRSPRGRRARWRCRPSR